jgi:hypothetical protein
MLNAKTIIAFLAAVLVGLGNWAFDHFMYDLLVSYIQNNLEINEAKIIASISSYVIPFLVSWLIFMFILKAMSDRQRTTQEKPRLAPLRDILPPVPDRPRLAEGETDESPYKITDYSDGTSDVEGTITFHHHIIRIKLPRFAEEPKISFFPDKDCIVEEQYEPKLVEPASFDGTARVQSIQAGGPYARWKWQAHGKRLQPQG